MNSINRKLLKLLQQNGRMTATALGKVVGLSRTAVQERICKLEQEGVILGYTVKFGPEHSRKFHKAIISVRIKTRPCATVLNQIVKLPAVTSCNSVAGEIDAFVTVAYETPGELSKLVDDISEITGVGSVNSHIVLAEL